LVIMDESRSLEMQGSFRFGAPAWFFIFTLVLWVCEVPFVSPWSIALFLCFREVVLCVCMSTTLCHWGLYGVGVSSSPLFFTMPLVSSKVVWCWSFKLSFVFHYASCVIEGCMVLEFQAFLCFSLCLLCHWRLYGVGVSSPPLFFTMPLYLPELYLCSCFHEC
jgi:hypothetical protein